MAKKIQDGESNDSSSLLRVDPALKPISGFTNRREDAKSSAAARDALELRRPGSGVGLCALRQSTVEHQNS
jgi:hypothetical protein